MFADFSAVTLLAPVFFVAAAAAVAAFAPVDAPFAVLATRRVAGLAAAFFATAGLATGFFATGFFATGFFATGFFATGFFPTAGFATGFFATSCFATGFFATDFSATDFFADDLVEAALAAGLVALVFGAAFLGGTPLLPELTFFTAMLGPFKMALRRPHRTRTGVREDRAIRQSSQWRNAAMDSIKPGQTSRTGHQKSR